MQKDQIDEALAQWISHKEEYEEVNQITSPDGALRNGLKKLLPLDMAKSLKAMGNSIKTLDDLISWVESQIEEEREPTFGGSSAASALKSFVAGSTNQGTEADGMEALCQLTSGFEDDPQMQEVLAQFG